LACCLCAPATWSGGIYGGGVAMSGSLALRLLVAHLCGEGRRKRAKRTGMLQYSTHTPYSTVMNRIEGCWTYVNFFLFL
jgi:hypothetical protein